MRIMPGSGTHIDQFEKEPGTDRWSREEWKDLRIRNNIQYSCDPISLELCKTLNHREKIVGVRYRSFKSIDSADPLRKAMGRENRTAHQRVIKVAMRVNQPGEDCNV